MEFRTLKYFVAVAREESITRAAEKLFFKDVLKILSLARKVETKFFIIEDLKELLLVLSREALRKDRLLTPQAQVLLEEMRNVR